MPMPATGSLQLYLWQGRMRVEMPVYIRRQTSHPMKALAAGASAPSWLDICSRLGAVRPDVSLFLPLTPGKFGH